MASPGHHPTTALWASGVRGSSLLCRWSQRAPDLSTGTFPIPPPLFFTVLSELS